MSIYLVRKYTTNGDKQNITTKTFEEALNAIDKSESEIFNTLKWLHVTDFFFRDTKDYIRKVEVAKI